MTAKHAPIVVAQDQAGVWHIALKTYESSAGTACGKLNMPAQQFRAGRPSITCPDCRAALATYGERFVWREGDFTLE